MSKNNLTTQLLNHSTKISIGALLVLISFSVWLTIGGSGDFREKLIHLIKGELVSIDPLPRSTVVDAIYVLGGSQPSLELKFKVAATLYHTGICNKILILSRPGITEYSNLLGRNLSNDEWAIMKLKNLGIPDKIIEPVSIESGFFGTLTEAKYISRLINERGYKSIILISCPCHANRVKISFRNFLKNSNVRFYVQGSSEVNTFKQLIIELFKLKIYDYFLVSSSS